MSGYPINADQSGNTPLLYRPEEAARALSISRTAVYGLIASGQLKSILIGRRRRIPRQAVEEFITARLEDS